MPVYPIHSRQAEPPPLWLIKDGENVTGPVPTWLLLRGITHGRLPSGCRVRQVGWSSWRNLSQIREVGQWRRRAALAIARPDALAPTRRFLGARIGRAESASEVLLFTLAAACAATGAELGAASVIREHGRPPSTSSVSGLTSYELLGLPVSASDLALAAARGGRSFAGSPATSAVHRATAARLGRGGLALSGVALFPLRLGAEPFAMVELGRLDHAFRRSDLGALERLGRAALERLQQLNS
jgi:hypothetical protein